MGVANISGNILTDSGASLSSYLPLTGGTLTGALNGTSATFSGQVTSDDLILTAGTLFGTGVTGFSNRASDTTLYLQMPATGFNITDNALNTKFIFSSSGAATFSSSVTANGVMSLSDDGTYGSNYKTLGFTGNTNGNHRIFAGVTDGMFICSKTGEGIFFRVNGGTTNNLAIASTGGATFTADIQSGGNIFSIITSASSAPSIYAQNNVGSITYLRTYGTSVAGTQFGIARAGWSSFDTNNGLGLLFGTTDNAPIVIGTANTERMRITSGGEVLIGGTGTTGSGLTIYNATVGGTGTEIRCTATSGNSVVQYNRMSVTGTTSNYFFAGQDNTQDKIYIYGNGNIVNRNGSYGTLSSDLKLKQDIVDANSQWDDIKNLRVVNFRYIEDVEREGDDALRQIGFIAQEVEKVSPSLVYETKSPESENTWKSIKTSIIHLKALKALQEAMAKIEELSAKITALENK